MPDHKFEPFQQVLVRRGERMIWRPGFYSHQETNDTGNIYHLCIGDDTKYYQCIPYCATNAPLNGKAISITYAAH